MHNDDHGGLPAKDIVRQSMLVHPDWDAAMHTWYLNEECHHLFDGHTEAAVQRIIDKINDEGQPMLTTTNPFAGLATASPSDRKTTEPPPTDRQVAFYENLLRRKGGCDEAEVARRIAKRKEEGGWTRASISKAIDRLVPMSDVDAPRTIEDGVYKTTDGRIVVVYHTVHGANQQVAKELIATKTGGKRKDGKDEWSCEFEYRGKEGLIGITVQQLLSEEEAKELGILYGFCVRCGKTLTRNESQYVGYGKRCASKMGWWYPTAAELRDLLTTTGDAPTTNTKEEAR